MGPPRYPTHPLAQPELNILQFVSSKELRVSTDASVIRQNFENAQDEEHHETLKRLYTAILDLTRKSYGPKSLAGLQGLNEISTLLEEFTVPEYRSCVEEPSKQRSLIGIVREIETDNHFDVLGPVFQLPGKATGDRRFICIFCHEVKVKTGDLRTHLAAKHKCDQDEIKQVFHRSKPQGLYVFGQYSYDDVRKNRWNVKDWRTRKPRSEASVNTKRKRCSSVTNLPPNMTNATSNGNNTQLPELTRDTTTITASPLPQTLPDYETPLIPESDFGIGPSTEDGLSSMESSSGDLAGVGTSDTQLNLKTLASHPQTLPAAVPRDTFPGSIDPQLIYWQNPGPWVDTVFLVEAQSSLAYTDILETEGQNTLSRRLNTDMDTANSGWAGYE